MVVGGWLLAVGSQGDQDDMGPLQLNTELGTILVVDACGARQNSHNEQNFPWADGHLNPNISFVDHLKPQALPIRRSYFVNFVHSVQKILSLVALRLAVGFYDFKISRML